MRTSRGFAARFALLLLVSTRLGSHTCGGLTGEAERAIAHAIAQSGVETFSLLELSGTSRRVFGGRLATRFPRATIVSLQAAANGQHASAGDEAARPGNHYFIACSAAEQARHLERLFDSPTIFSFVVALDSEKLKLADVGLLVGVARQVFVAGKPSGPHMRRIRAAAVARAVQIAHFLTLRGNVLQVVSGGFERNVRHHFADNRRCPKRGYRFVYTYARTVGQHHGVISSSSPPRLERLKYGASRSSLRKGGTAVDAFGCDYTNQRKGPVLSQPSWVNLFTLSGLGLASGASDALKRQILRGVLSLPHFDDGVPWNACLDAANVTWCDMDYEGTSAVPMREDALRGSCEGGRDWRDEKSPPCILDMMLLAVTGCSSAAGCYELRDAWFGGSGNTGDHPKGRPLSAARAKECREAHAIDV
mmetsp:Transcript_39549/g.99395  ORF Transcript_39549/g.99395 Transcript_39549/m.99395 type:complete len:420 (-) Transcript_39549:300-1559(-)